MTRSAPIALFPLLLAASLVAAPALAQPTEEGPDPTRLDVERLPPEAIEVSRELYAHGFFLETQVGGRGFVGGLGRYSHPGLWASIGLGYEIFGWLWVRVALEGSIHGTNAPAPPSPTVFELLGITAEGRVQLAFSARFAIWLGLEAGLLTAAQSEVLLAYGFQDAESLGPMFGGSLGIDWHMLNRHHSIGILGGARLYPSLTIFDEQAIGLHAAAYLRYVF